MENKITAKHAGSGVWDFECMAHEPHSFIRMVSAPKESLKTMEGHIDREHPGQRFQVKRFSSGHTDGKGYSYIGKAG
jgi:hypothetical protein